MSKKMRGTVFVTAALAIAGAVGGFAHTLQLAPATEQTAPPAAGPCQGVRAQRGQLPVVLSSVSRYGSTYVLVVPQRLADSVPNAAAPAVKNLQAGAQGPMAAEAARAIGIAHVRELPYDESNPIQPLQDVVDGKLDAVVMWAPLASFGILDLGIDAQVSVFAIDRPHPAPEALQAPAGPAGPCAAAVREELDASGVLPAELLVPVEIRTLLTRRPPAFDLAQAREGGAVFNDLCSRCHGPDAVADPHGLAPVDLRISVRRFSYPGFSYIVLNGRPQKSMPPLRGTVTDDQISLIYEYLKARSDNLLPGSSGAPVPAKQAALNGGSKR